MHFGNNHLESHFGAVHLNIVFSLFPQYNLPPDKQAFQSYSGKDMPGWLKLQTSAVQLATATIRYADYGTDHVSEHKAAVSNVPVPKSFRESDKSGVKAS